MNLLAKNVAAWALKPKQRPLTVSSAPFTSPPKGYIVVLVNDVAINPIDWILQDGDIFKLDYPTVFGSDIAGDIVAMGEDVTDFKIGQRVIANCTRDHVEGVPKAAFGGFQKYVLVRKTAAAELPPKIRTSEGVVLPLGITTAAAGLFQPGYLALPLPSEDSTWLGRIVLVWGGSSSVGSCAIQLAKATGATVITTASPANFKYCKNIGAKQVFDYHCDDVEEQILDYLHETRWGVSEDRQVFVGAYHAAGGDDAVQACARILDKAAGKAIVVTVKGVPDNGIPDSVRVKAIRATDIFSNDVGPYIWRKFLPRALKNGSIVPKPDPKIVGEELRSVQLGLDTQKKGVSAEKIVVSYIS